MRSDKEESAIRQPAVPVSGAVTPSVRRPRVLVLATAHSYRLEPFLKAAEKLGVDVVRGLDVPPAHTGAGSTALRLDFRDPERAVRQVQRLVRDGPLDAILPTDDATVVLAARLCAALGLRHNSPAAAEAARDKYRMRQLLARAGVRVPAFERFTAGQAPDEVVPVVARRIGFPCVVKPTCLSGSRGVIRADDAAGLAAAFRRTSGLVAATGGADVLVEAYLPGAEYAVEGLLSDGRLKVLALFDKPDPLEGPYFEETLYVTPSRAVPAVQANIAACVAEAARALGLREGAVHGEVRANAQGTWLIEVAGRSIGGLCAQTLRFAQGADVTLEELILRQALGLPADETERERQAGGVMMIPIPAAGTLVGVDGVAQAQAVPGIEAVEITAKLNYPVVPLPEGESYLGFVFARAETPAEVEAALRAAHAQLRFEIEPDLAPVFAA